MANSSAQIQLAEMSDKDLWDFIISRPRSYKYLDKDRSRYKTELQEWALQAEGIMKELYPRMIKG